MRRLFAVSVLALAAALVPLAAHAQEAPAVTAASAAPIIQSWAFILFTAATGIVALASALAHVFPATTGFGKFVSVVALNGGKLLTEIQSTGLVEKKPNGYTRLPVLASLAAACLCLSACQFFAPTLKADLLACGAAVTKDVEAQVAATLLAGGLSWQTDLYKLGEKVGNDGLICAIQVAIKDFESQHAVEPASAPQANALTMPALDSHTLAIARAHVALANLNATPH